MAKSKSTLLSKTKRRLKELFYGDKAYTPGHKKVKVVKASAQERARKPYLEAGISETNLRGLRPALYKKKKK